MTAHRADTEDGARFVLTFGHLVEAAGISLDETLVIRHVYRPDGLPSRLQATPERVLDYTRGQDRKPGKIPPKPPPWWFVFMAEPGPRARLFAVYENRGEIEAERTETERFFDLQESDRFTTLRNRLAIDWGTAPINWAVRGTSAAHYPVVEIADPQAVAFPGYLDFVLTYDELQQVVSDSRYASWRTALSVVHGIYLIVDSQTGQQYVGKADGGQSILGRWTAYATNGHGHNVAMRELVTLDPTQPRRYLFSVLRTFSSHTPQAEIDAAESHYKRALLTRTHGLNRN